MLGRQAGRQAWPAGLLNHMHAAVIYHTSYSNRIESKPASASSHRGIVPGIVKTVRNSSLPAFGAVSEAHGEHNSPTLHPRTNHSPPTLANNDSNSNSVSELFSEVYM